MNQNRYLSILLLTLAVLGLDPPTPSWAQPTTTEVKRLTASDDSAGDGFGRAVAISGDVAVVGAYLDDTCVADPTCSSGSAYVFGRDQNGRNEWGEAAKISVGEASTLLGLAPAVSGDTVAVDARGHNAGTGAVYVFERDQGGPNTWGQVRPILASDGQVGDEFGTSVALSMDTLVVGARFSDGGCVSDPNCNSGSAYVFERNLGGPDNWGEAKRLHVEVAPALGDKFGSSVAVSGDTAVVGATLGDASLAAYVFGRDQGGPGNWGWVKTIIASDAVSEIAGEINVATSGDVVVLGAPLKDDVAGTDAGSAYVFERDRGGPNNWGEVKLAPSEAEAGDRFGASVSISGDTVVVGADQFCPPPGDPSCKDGKAFVFRRNEGGTDNWGEVLKLTASDAELGDGFGITSAIDGETIVVGGNFNRDGCPTNDPNCDSGSAYVFLTAPALRIPDVPVAPGFQAHVPVTFFGYGNEVAATTFSVAFDAACLDLDPTDADGDGIPDAVSFSVPGDFSRSVSFTHFGAVGELDFTVADFSAPLAALPDGDLATITFTPTCVPSGADIRALVSFGLSPAASFGNTQGQDVPGQTFNGSAELLAGSPGDCNGDGSLTAGDVSACVLEVFDGDGDVWTEVTRPTFFGNPVGCDANQDLVVNAGDLSCKVLLIFNGPGACGLSLLRAKSSQAELRVGRATSPGAGAEVTVPLSFSGEARGVTASTFSLDYDESCLAFDPADGISFSLPAGVTPSVDFDAADTDGEIDVTVLDLSLPFATLPDGPVATLRFTNLCDPGDGAVDAFVRFSAEPPLSFGDTLGQSVPGIGVAGGVTVTAAFFVDGFESGDTTAWSNSVP